MRRLITFSTSQFNPAEEPENEFNQIAGYSVLKWLIEALGLSVMSTQPDSEDWGWYIDVEFNGQKYLVGASDFLYGDYANIESAPVEWVVQISKYRTLLEKITGKNKQTPLDTFSQLVESRIRENPQIQSVEVENAA